MAVICILGLMQPQYIWNACSKYAKTGEVTFTDTIRTRTEISAAPPDAHPIAISSPSRPDENNRAAPIGGRSPSRRGGANVDTSIMRVVV